MSKTHFETKILFKGLLHNSNFGRNPKRLSVEEFRLPPKIPDFCNRLFKHKSKMRHLGFCLFAVTLKPKRSYSAFNYCFIFLAGFTLKSKYFYDLMLKATRIKIRLPFPFPIG